MFSILVLTKNEEINVGACLESVRWSDDVVLLDSFSNDRTVTIAEENGARVIQRQFDDFGAQRNWALDKIPFKNSWVFHLDADERFNEGLRYECETAIRKDSHSGYFVPNRIIFLGRWIRHSTQYPYPQLRFLKIGEVRFAKAGHGQREDRMVRSLGQINVPYDHFNFSKGVSDWVEKHNRYSSEEAKDAVDSLNEKLQLRDLCVADSIKRKRLLKKFHTQMPLRWLVKFFYLYVVKLGFLDRYPGFVYCVLQSFYDFLITVKARELRDETRSQP